MNKKNFLFFCIALLAFSFAIYQAFLSTHEQAHKDIFDYAGTQSTVHIGFFSGSVTPKELPKQDLSNLYAAQSIVEANAQLATQQIITNILLFAGILLLAIKK